MQDQKPKEKTIDDKLIEAAENLNYEQVKQLLEKGANPNYILYTDSNCWYSGNTHTPLYSAVHSNKSQNTKNYIDVIELLLKHKANPNFKATRGGWNHCESYPTFNGVMRQLSRITDMDEKIRLIKLFVEAGININQSERHGRDKAWRAHSTHTCFLFNMLQQSSLYSKIDELRSLRNEVKLDRLQREVERELRKQFYEKIGKNIEEKNPQMGEYEEEEEEEEEEKKQEKKEQKVIDTRLIEALMGFGADPNSFKRYSYWENYGEDEEGETIDNHFETVLHRAIMNNCPKLVRIILEKGGKSDAQCRFTYEKVVPPSQWSEELKGMKKNANEKRLQEAQQNRDNYLKRLAALKEKKAEKKDDEKKQEQIEEGGEEGEEEEEHDYNDNEEDLLQSIEAEQFNIYKAKRYVVENALPFYRYQQARMSCMELAESLECCQQIIDLLNKFKTEEKKQQK